MFDIGITIIVLCLFIKIVCRMHFRRKLDAIREHLIYVRVPLIRRTFLRRYRITAGVATSCQLLGLVMVLASLFD